MRNERFRLWKGEKRRYSKKMNKTGQEKSVFNANEMILLLSVSMEAAEYSLRQNVHLALVRTRPSSESSELSCPKYTTNLARAYGGMTLIWITSTHSRCFLFFSCLYFLYAGQRSEHRLYMGADQNHRADAWEHKPNRFFMFTWEWGAGRFLTF